MRRAAPARAFLHPLWILSLLTLAANDHLFKVGGTFPPWLTGKLSDFAGLMVAPLVLAALCCARSRRGILWSHVAIGAVFSAIKLSPQAAAGFEALTALTPFPWYAIQVDPTDLIALPMIVLSYLVLVPWTEREQGASIFAKAALIPGALACAATAPTPPTGPGQRFFPPVNAALTVANDTEDTLVVRVRELKREVEIDCFGAALDDPGAVFGREAFDVTTTWTIDPNRAIPIGERFSGRECEVFLVEGDELPPRIIFWSTSEFSIRSLPSTAKGADPARAILVRAGEAGPQWEPHRLLHGHHPRPVEGALAECKVGSSDPVLEWAEPIPLGEHRITQLKQAPGGCWAFDLLKNEVPVRWYACVDQIELPFAAGQVITLQIDLESANSRTVTITGTTASVQLNRWILPLARLEPIESCGGYVDACGNHLAPSRVATTDGAPAGAGESYQSSGGTVHVVRAEQVVVAGFCAGREKLKLGARVETVELREGR